MPKREHIPETRDAKPNREQRRHPEREQTPENAALSHDARESVTQGSQDVASIRAKSSGHGKKAADKWNQ